MTPRLPLAAALACALLLPTATARAQAPAILPIGQVQGAVADDADGATHRSPFAPPSGNGNGQTVTVQGIVTQKLLQRTAAGGDQNSFFLQEPAATSDGDPNTSDGILVFHGRFTTLLRDGGGTYTPQVGDEIVVRGPVQEFFSMTELNNPRLVSVVAGGRQSAIDPYETAPPDDLAAAKRYWERREGMQGTVPEGGRVLGGRNVFPSTADGEVWVMRGDHPLAQRPNPFARRAFRDPHPLDDQPEPLFDNGNGYRILLGSLGIKASAGDNRTLIAPARTFQSVTNAVTGGTYFAFNKYSIQPAAQPQLADGADPSRNAPPPAPRTDEQYSVANYNLENLYDFRDDPTDGCDFTGNTGCAGVSPPFDYVPASDAAYRSRLDVEASQITHDLHAPDLLLVQEAEDQDICHTTDAALVCDHGDGRPDTLQDLALAVKAQGGPRYEAVLDRDGADDRGIVSGFLYRTDRVTTVAPDASDPVLGDTPAIDYRGTPLAMNAQVSNPKALNAALPADVDRSTGTDGDDVFTRAPQVGRFRIWRDRVGRGKSVVITAISNHFSSTPQARVGQRTEQARYNAAIVRAISGAPGGDEERVLVGGDLNVFPRPDDPFAPGDPLFRSDQLGPLYDEARMRNLWDTLVREVPASAYSYVFEGQAQTLDHQFVNRALLDDLAGVRVAHVNADWPADEDGDGPRGASDHDPVVSRFDF